MNKKINFLNLIVNDRLLLTILLMNHLFSSLIHRADFKKMRKYSALHSLKKSGDTTFTNTKLESKLTGKCLLNADLTCLLSLHVTFVFFKILSY